MQKEAVYEDNLCLEINSNEPCEFCDEIPCICTHVEKTSPLDWDKNYEVFNSVSEYDEENFNYEDDEDEDDYYDNDDDEYDEYDDDDDEYYDEDDEYYYDANEDDDEDGYYYDEDPDDYWYGEDD